MAMVLKKNVEDLKVAGKRVIVRVDFNVPLDENGKITDDTRITAAVETIRHITERGGKVILMSHLGRPKNGPDAKLSLAPVAARLSARSAGSSAAPGTPASPAAP